MALKKLKGRWVLVTGAASGIGHETALAFARNGANILAVDLDAARLDQTRSLCEAMHVRCFVYGCDVSDVAAVEELRQRIEADSGPPHVLINNAGIGFLGPFLETPESAWRAVFGVNVMGIVHMSRAFLPGMIAAADDRSLVNIASAAGLQAVPNLSAYSASKHAVMGLSDTLAMELRNTKIAVTVVCPGIINTAIVANPRAVAESVPKQALEQLERNYKAHGAHPSLVGESIVKAVKRGEDLVLVGPSAKSVFEGRRMSRKRVRKASIAGARTIGYLWD